MELLNDPGGPSDHHFYGLALVVESLHLAQGRIAQAGHFPPADLGLPLWLSQDATINHQSADALAFCLLLQIAGFGPFGIQSGDEDDCFGHKCLLHSLSSETRFLAKTGFPFDCSLFIIRYRLFIISSIPSTTALANSG
jgi:hypothetical protein